MATVPIEVMCIGHDKFVPVENAIYFLNKYQDAFNFKLLRDTKWENFQRTNENYFTTKEIYNFLKDVSKELKGYHPYIIGVLVDRLNGDYFCNLFGSMQEYPDTKKLTGKSVISTWKINEMLDPIPVDVYIIFEFLSLSMRFVIGQNLIHDERRMCVFDRKVNRIDIVPIISKCKFCDSCTKQIVNLLDNDQIIAINHIINKINLTLSH
jgi:hypothetical protein